MAPPRNLLGAVVFGVGTLVSVAFAFYNLRPLIVTPAGSEGVDTVSSLTFELLQYFIPPVLAFTLSRRIRGRGRMARRLRRVHFLTTVGWVVLVGLLSLIIVAGGQTLGVSGLGLMVMFATLLGGALWLPVQTLFSAAFLALLIRGKHRMSRHVLQSSFTSAGH